MYRLYTAEGLSIRKRKKTKRVWVFAAEWTPSDNMAELPVIPATMNFITAMATPAPVAPLIASLECAIAACASGPCVGAAHVMRPRTQRPAAAAVAVSAVPQAISTKVRRNGQPLKVARLLRS